MAYNWGMPGTEKIIIYCDGACSGNQYRCNTGGWGAILQRGDLLKEIHGGELDTTNQRMELTACIMALERLKSGKYVVEVYTDSAYLVSCINDKWYTTWQKNGWKNSDKKPVVNRDLWEKLLALLSLYKVVFIKVAGHSGNKLNERADELARQGIEKANKSR
ncbi:MAG: ribonuclease HI [Chloroflexi bacterium]|nr:ribonuclease HI [Chloroflexota bacterium]